MTSALFPDIRQSEEWYAATVDGLAVLSRAVKDGRRDLALRTINEVLFVPVPEAKAFFEYKRVTNETFATLALFAACEGGIRRDFLWRSTGNRGQLYHLPFEALHSSDGDHVGISRLLDVWISVLTNGSYARSHILKLKNLFQQRNELAHGRASLGAFAFEPTYQTLIKVREKWTQAVPDFEGF